jgi:NAD/NADP transhydrogenase alpha subunit
MKVGIPKESYPHELRVAATPDTVEKMVKLGLEVAVETGAGDAASFSDAAYAEANRFEEAIANATKVRDLALSRGERQAVAAADVRLAEYRNRRPYRQQPSLRND